MHDAATRTRLIAHPLTLPVDGRAKRRQAADEQHAPMDTRCTVARLLRKIGIERGRLRLDPVRREAARAEPSGLLVRLDEIIFNRNTNDGGRDT
ncbi:hypothetical protein QTI24_21415 [Variovorax sp. J22P240]|uniref:hypothetical protein n=1 Tax=Variovorax sp. J22P240 TaxID=3053514 RepID=UPI002575C3FB|nr:hypothetical protein [Variovorax sp. J22P240]MDM0001181.1 hypothetical protein [Variovorax sp. J22P240]